MITGRAITGDRCVPFAAVGPRPRRSQGPRNTALRATTDHYGSFSAELVVRLSAFEFPERASFWPSNHSGSNHS